MNKKNVLLVARSSIVQMSISIFLENAGDTIEKYKAIENPTNILDSVREHKIDFIILDYAFCRFDASNEIKKIKKIFPELIVLVFNFEHSEFEKIHLLKAGINALLPPETDLVAFLIMIRELKIGDVHINGMISSKLLERLDGPFKSENAELTMQEISLIRDRCNGMDNASIANKYYRSISRIENIFHVIHIKTGCKTQIDFIRYALMYKIINWEILMDQVKIGA